MGKERETQAAPKASLVLHDLPLANVNGIVTEDELRGIFRDFGALRERNKHLRGIVIRPVQCMAFINFVHPEGAALALENLYDHERYHLISPLVVAYAKSNGVRDKRTHTAFGSHGWGRHDRPRDGVIR